MTAILPTLEFTIELQSPQILACNEDGYISTSPNYSADECLTIDLNSIISSWKY